MASIEKLMIMGCVIRHYEDAAGNVSITLWSSDYKINLQFIHQSTFERYMSRLYLMRRIEIPTGECYSFYRLIHS